MCGRYALSLAPSELQLAFDLIELPEDFAPRYNIAPTQPVLMITAEDPRAARWARWGLIPRWAKDTKMGAKMINARAESVAEKPVFRDAFRKRRCLVLADGFYEWRGKGKDKTPMFVRLRSGEPFAFAGLWETWEPKPPEGGGEPAAAEPITSCAIITTNANALLDPIHDRMPVMLARADFARWLSAETDEAELLSLLRPAPDDELEVFAVNPAVNSVKNEGPELIEPAPEQLELG